VSVFRFRSPTPYNAATLTEVSGSPVATGMGPVQVVSTP